jgi:hypothetical protein
MGLRMGESFGTILSLLGTSGNKGDAGGELGGVDDDGLLENEVAAT